MKYYKVSDDNWDYNRLIVYVEGEGTYEENVVVGQWIHDELRVDVEEKEITEKMFMNLEQSHEVEEVTLDEYKELLDKEMITFIENNRE